MHTDLQLYVNGVLTTQVDNRVLAIQRTVPLGVGSFTPSNVASNAAIARLRLHDGLLTPAQVAYNYLTEAAFLGLVSSPSETPSIPATPSNTASASGSKTASTTGTGTRSVTPSQTGTASSSGTSSNTVTATSSRTSTGSPSLTPR